MSLPRYPKYKDSGVQWLGQVPEHWEVTRTKHVIQFTTGWTPPTGNSSAYEGENLWANISDLAPEIIHDTAKRISDEAVEISSIKPSPKGSLLFSFKLSIGQVSFVGRDMFTNEAIATFLPSASLNLRFAYYAFPKFLVQNASENIYGARLLNQELIRSATFPLPTLAEQTAIAQFLDAETAKIDALIEEQRRLIELLKEKRQAVISHAVTKGLDPNVPLKDSGIEWLGQVPKHWEVKPLKRLIRLIESGTSVNATDQPAEGRQTAVLKTSCVYTGRFRPSENKVVVPEEIERVSCPLRLGALIVSRMNTPELVGAAGHVVNAPPNIFLPDRLWQVTFIQTEVAFIHYWTLTRTYRDQVQCACAGTSSSMQNLAQDQFGAFVLVVPPASEQLAIANFLDAETAKIDTLTAEAERAIELLGERRSTLISAAVTGQIDVRGIAIQKAA